LLPGMCLKVIDQLDLGTGLVGIQLEEIPSEVEVNNILLKDEVAIGFWSKISEVKFTVPLNDFCEGVLDSFQIPLIKTFDKCKSDNDKEYFEKYWTLWFFAGGDPKTFLQQFHPTSSVDDTAEMITIEKFGSLLGFGQFKKDGFLHGLWIAAQSGNFYLETTTSTEAANKLRGNLGSWLVRCSTTNRECPFVLSVCNNNGAISHTRIHHNHQVHDSAYSIPTLPRITATTIHELITKLKQSQVQGIPLMNPYFVPIFNLQDNNQSEYYENPEVKNYNYPNKK